MTARRLPWATVAIALVAVVSYGVASVGDALIYDRAAVLRGQVWRLWTGHGVHFTLAHLIWNLALFGFVGSWLERVAPAATRWFFVVMPAFIAGLLLVLDPSLARYAGLSGLGAGMTVLLALRQWRLPKESRLIWTAVLGLVALKVAIEWGSGVPLLTEGIRSVPLAHAAGILGGVAWFGLERRADRRV